MLAVLASASRGVWRETATTTTTTEDKDMSRADELLDEIATMWAESQAHPDRRVELADRIAEAQRKLDRELAVEGLLAQVQIWGFEEVAGEDPHAAAQPRDGR